jgi:O-antigen ligase
VANRVVMSEQIIVGQNAGGHARINRATARLCTFLLAATAGFTLTLSAYLEEFRATHVGAVLLVLNTLHLVWHSRFIWRREFTLYAYFVGYMLISLLWTRDVDLAMNTLVPAINCILAMIFFGSLIRYNNVPTALVGTLCGFVVGAALYTLTQGFPFSYPEVFSYNAIASMYLFGLFITLMCSCFRRSNGLFLAIAVVIMLHIVATTSIKTNIGIVLGLIAAGIMYFGHFGRLLRRRILILIVLACGLGFAIASNRGLVDAMDRGVQRVFVGVKVLQARDDVAGYSAFEQRDYWKQAGIDGWKLNPVFGYGAEAFRDEFGITSHSTPIDLLYNYGLIGLMLFYSVFASMSWRLVQLDGRQVSDKRSVILAGVVCYLFMSLSGTMHYNVFLAAFIGISVALLHFHGITTGSTRGPSIQRVGRQ